MGRCRCRSYRSTFGDRVTESNTARGASRLLVPQNHSFLADPGHDRAPPRPPASEIPRLIAPGQLRGGRATADALALLHALELAHLEVGHVYAAVGLAHCRRIAGRATRAAGLPLHRVRAARGLAHRLRAQPGLTPTRRQREGQGYHQRDPTEHSSTIHPDSSFSPTAFVSEWPTQDRDDLSLLVWAAGGTLRMASVYHTIEPAVKKCAPPNRVLPRTEQKGSSERPRGAPVFVPSPLGVRS